MPLPCASCRSIASVLLRLQLLFPNAPAMPPLRLLAFVTLAEQDWRITVQPSWLECGRNNLSSPFRLFRVHFTCERAFEALRHFVRPRFWHTKSHVVVCAALADRSFEPRGARRSKGGISGDLSTDRPVTWTAKIDSSERHLLGTCGAPRLPTR